MRSVVPSDSRYTPLVQQPWCCVPACISMVMYKQDIQLVPQEVLGHLMGLIVPKEDAHYFMSVRTGKEPKTGYGTQINKKRYAMNAAFSKLKIPLQMVYHDAKNFTQESLLTFLKDCENQNKDVFACFDIGALVGIKKHGGHVCLFDRVDAKQKNIRLVDPASRQPKWRVVEVDALLRGMKYHANLMGGLWEIQCTDGRH